MNELDAKPQKTSRDFKGKIVANWKDLSLLTRIWYGIAVASVVLNVAAMAIAGPALAVVSGIVAVLIAPAVVYLQSKLEDTDSKSYEYDIFDDIIHPYRLMFQKF